MKHFRFWLALYFLFLPFQFALAPAEGVDLAVIRVVTLVIVGIWAVSGLIRRELIFPNLLALFFLSSFILLSFGSALWSLDASTTLRKSLFFLSFLPLFWVLSSLFFEERTSRGLLLQAYVVGATIGALTGIILFLSQFLLGVERVFSLLTKDILPFFLGATFAQSVAEHPSLLVNVSGTTLLRASGVFPDPHMFSLYMAMALPLALGFFFDATSPRRKQLWMGSFLLLLTGVLLSFSRGSYVAVLGGLGIFFLVSTAWQTLSLRRKSVIFFGGVIFFAVLTLSPVGQRFFSSFSEEDGSNIERLRLWQEAVVHIGERPFLGVGLGSYPLLVKPSAVYRDPIYAHNLFLDITLELGCIGLFFLLALFVQSLRGAVFEWRRVRNWQALSVGTAILIFLGHAFFETPLFSVHILPVLVLFLAIGVSYTYDQHAS